MVTFILSASYIFHWLIYSCPFVVHLLSILDVKPQVANNTSIPKESTLWSMVIIVGVCIISILRYK